MFSFVSRIVALPRHQ